MPRGREEHNTIYAGERSVGEETAGHWMSAWAVVQSEEVGIQLDSLAYKAVVLLLEVVVLLSTFSFFP